MILERIQIPYFRDILNKYLEISLLRNKHMRLVFRKTVILSV